MPSFSFHDPEKSFVFIHPFIPLLFFAVFGPLSRKQPWCTGGALPCIPAQTLRGSRAERAPAGCHQPSAPVLSLNEDCKDKAWCLCEQRAIMGIRASTSASLRRWKWGVFAGWPLAPTSILIRMQESPQLLPGASNSCILSL